MKGDWGHFSAAGLLRQLKSGDESETGAALSLSGRFNIGANDDIRWMANYGSGIGRYLGFGLGAVSGVGGISNNKDKDVDSGFVARRPAFHRNQRTTPLYTVANGRDTCRDNYCTYA